MKMTRISTSFFVLYTFLTHISMTQILITFAVFTFFTGSFCAEDISLISGTVYYKSSRGHIMGVPIRVSFPRQSVVETTCCNNSTCCMTDSSTQRNSETMYSYSQRRLGMVKPKSHFPAPIQRPSTKPTIKPITANIKTDTANRWLVNQSIDGGEEINNRFKTEHVNGVRIDSEIMKKTGPSCEPINRSYDIVDLIDKFRKR